MGIFYSIHSVALIEDLPLEHKYNTTKMFFDAADLAYNQVTVFFLKYTNVKHLTTENDRESERGTNEGHRQMFTT